MNLDSDVFHQIFNRCCQEGPFLLEKAKIDLIAKTDKDSENSRGVRILREALKRQLKKELAKKQEKLISEAVEAARSVQGQPKESFTLEAEAGSFYALIEKPTSSRFSKSERIIAFKDLL